MWHPIPDCPGYEITEAGEVRSCRCGGEWRLLKTRIGTIGYWVATLPHPKGFRPHFIHRILAKLFIPNPENLPEVNHKDGVKSNNALSNLEWTTHRGNLRHASRTGLMPFGDRSGTAKISDKDIPEVRRLIQEAKEPYEKIAVRFGVTRATIGRFARGKRRDVAGVPNRRKVGDFLTTERVMEIKRLLRDGAVQAHIAKRFGISVSHINGIKMGRSWKHIKDPS